MFSKLPFCNVRRGAIGIVALAASLASAVTSLFAADELPKRFFDAPARQIAKAVAEGEGWCVVSARQKVQLAPKTSAVDCIKYRIVTGCKAGKTSNDQDYVELEYSEETPWIAAGSGMPTASGSSLAAAKKANELVAALDEALGQLQSALDDENPAARAIAQGLADVLTKQRAALVDVIQKDIKAIR